MLSSQTKDTTNAMTMARLYKELPAYKEGAPIGLNLENILAVDPKLLMVTRSDLDPVTRSNILIAKRGT